MPPRIRVNHVEASIPQLCLSTRPATLTPCPPSHQIIRTFYRRPTRLRRQLWAWLKGPGRVFKDPLPGSTNYLGAYDNGRLIRASGMSKEKIQEQQEEELGRETKEALREGEKNEKSEKEEEQEVIEGSDEDVQKLKVKDKRDGRLPPETLEDLRPFPLNPHFRSQAVLSEELREEIWARVKAKGESVRVVSATFGVAMERVAAVVRLKEIEKQWIKEGISLAKPYSRAVLAMLPITPLKEDKGTVPHEPINDLPVHPATRRQLFYPTAESRVFTRADAGRAFKNNLLPAEERIPHPELVQVEKDRLSGMSIPAMVQAQAERNRAEAEAKARRGAKAKAERGKQQVVKGKRWDFRFTDINAEDVGKDGRSPKGVGWRYGFPHEDRKKGQIKIPTSVNV